MPTTNQVPDGTEECCGKRCVTLQRFCESSSCGTAISSDVSTGGDNLNWKTVLLSFYVNKCFGIMC